MSVDDQDSYVVGVDFGTLSGRAVVVRVSDGELLGAGVHNYEHAVMDTVLVSTGQSLPPEWALQVPADYVSVLKNAVPEAVAAAGIGPRRVVGIATDVTATTALPVMNDGTPLCEVEGFETQPHAYVKLWKHHAAQAHADRINELARDRDESWLARYGGFISSEWQFAKALQLLEEAPELYRTMDLWVEAADWIVWQLGGALVRNPCTAGYKGILQNGEYPSHEFLAALNPEFADFATVKLAGEIGSLGSSAGTLTAEAAVWTGLPEGIAVAVGNVDAHVTAPAARAVEPGQMLAIMGTSTCHVMNSTELADVTGMCGVVDGGIVDGMYGYEAGQSGVGDIFAWYVENQVPAKYFEDAAAAGVSIHQHLTNLAYLEPVGAHGLIALDWNGGNRSVLVNAELSGLLVGQTLVTRPEQIYRALLESTAFGTRMIVDTFNAAGVPVSELVVAGGLLKNPQLMQTYSDVLGMPISTAVSTQGPALGSAIHAAVAAGAYPNVRAAGESMGRVLKNAYEPNPADVEAYAAIYADYRELHDLFGRGSLDVMKRAKTRRKVALS